ncbi:ATP-binding protein [Granulosicoccaceae sp. 1_MG-2023]|nr:ATP-binding protein [Granulosicoccaceae sp. 1_MG-2023]
MSTQSGKEDPAHQRLVGEAVRFMYANIARISAIQLFFPLALAWLFWPHFPHSTVLLWSSAVIGVYLSRILLARAFHRQSTISDPQRWARYFTFTSLASGLLWGLASRLFYVADAVQMQVLLYVLIVGVAVGSLIVTCYWLPAFFAYTLTSVGILAVHLISLGSPAETILAVLLVLYVVMFSRVAVQTRQLMYHGIQVQFDNVALVQQLREAKEKAEAANRAKTRFLASANHDLRQPVHALSLMTHAARQEMDSPRGQRLHSNMSRTVQNLGQLLESLLDLSRLDADAMRVQRAHCNLEALGAQLRTEFLPLAQRKKLRFGLRFFDKNVYTDIALLERILRNLIGNAIRYTNVGGVLVACRRRGENVVIEVWDSGVGIEDSEGEAIFSEFYQCPAKAQESNQGLGLGLSICHRVAALLGHQLSYHSERGRGTVFRLTLPAGAAADRVTCIKEPQCGQALSGRTIVLIDSDPLAREILREILVQWGVVVHCASAIDGAEAILSGHDGDLVICDCRSAAGQSPAEKVAGLRRMAGNKALPCLLLSGDTHALPEKDVEGLGQVAVMHKPVPVGTLYHAVVKLLGQPRAEAVLPPAQKA